MSKCDIYTSREDKYEWVYKHFKDYLKVSVLDVGADKCRLSDLLIDTTYCGVGLEGCDVNIDLEKNEIPGKQQQYSTVICLDVLEHLENIHSTFDRICYLSEKYVLISLPNAYLGLMEFVFRGPYNSGQNMKFYGLPNEKPIDRHKWFFSAHEACDFVKYRAEKNSFEVKMVLDTSDYKRQSKSSLVIHILKILFFWRKRTKRSLQHFESDTLYFLLSRKF